jgi:hypothetical protein
VQALRDKAFELVLADRLAQRVSVVASLRYPPPRAVEAEALDLQREPGDRFLANSCGDPIRL